MCRLLNTDRVSIEFLLDHIIVFDFDLCFDLLIFLGLSYFQHFCGLLLRCVIVIVHVNGNNVDHDLSNQNIDDNEHDEGEPISIVTNEILNRLFRQQNLLLIDNESIEEHNTRS